MYEHIGHEPFGAPEELIEDVSPNRFSRCRPEFLRVKHVKEMLALFYFFHVFCILTFHSVLHEPVRGSQNAGRAVIYAAALWRLAHSRCGKKYSACALRLRILHYLWRLVCLLCSGRWDFHILCDCIYFIYIFFSPPASLTLTYWTRTPCFAKCSWETLPTPKEQTNKPRKKKKWLAWKNKMTLCLKMFSLSLSSLCVRHCRLWKPTWHPKTATGSMLTRWGQTQTPVHTCARAMTDAHATWQPLLRCQGSRQQQKKRAVTSFFFSFLDFAAHTGLSLLLDLV